MLKNCLLFLCTSFLFNFTYSQHTSKPTWAIDTDELSKGKHVFLPLKKADTTFWNVPSTLKQYDIHRLNLFTIDTVDNNYVILTLLNDKDILNQNSIYSLFFNEKNEVIAVSENYIDASRMGSCGTISITNTAYLQNNKIEYVEAKETPFNCYNHPIDKIKLQLLADFFSKRIATVVL